MHKLGAWQGLKILQGQEERINSWLRYRMAPWDAIFLFIEQHWWLKQGRALPQGAQNLNPIQIVQSRHGRRLQLLFIQFLVLVRWGVEDFMPSLEASSSGHLWRWKDHWSVRTIPLLTSPVAERRAAVYTVSWRQHGRSWSGRHLRNCPQESWMAVTGHCIEEDTAAKFLQLIGGPCVGKGHVVTIDVG